MNPDKTRTVGLGRGEALEEDVDGRDGFLMMIIVILIMVLMLGPKHGADLYSARYDVT
jgi:hypothetical protein